MLNICIRGTSLTRYQGLTVDTSPFLSPAHVPTLTLSFSFSRTLFRSLSLASLSSTLPHTPYIAISRARARIRARHRESKTEERKRGASSRGGYCTSKLDRLKSRLRFRRFFSSSFSPRVSSFIRVPSFLHSSSSSSSSLRFLLLAFWSFTTTGHRPTNCVPRPPRKNLARVRL